MGKLISALPFIVPVLVTDVRTGEVNPEAYHQDVTSLLSLITTQVTLAWAAQKDQLVSDCQAYKRLSPAEYGRQKGYTLGALPSAVLAKSRVERLYRHKLISEISSYVNNLNPRKQEPAFSAKVNLGAVDSQMATLSLNDSILTLKWKCWENEYLLEFEVPAYILSRDIIKFSLPTVQLNKKGEVVYGYSVEEKPRVRTVGTQRAGVDLGRVEPFTLAVINKSGNRIADYTTAPRLRQVNNKRERLLVQKQQVRAKIAAYKALGINTLVLEQERDFITHKVTRMGNGIAQQIANDITRKLAKHDLNVLNVEDLSWVTGKRYGSRWNHSAQQEAMTHSLARAGIRVKKVNPRDTSKNCHDCGTTLVYNTKSRTVWCVVCKTRLDRDWNAALSVAKKTYPIVKRTSGGNYSSTVKVEQVTEPKVHKSVLKKLSITRKAT